MSDKTSTYVDYQQRALEFSVGDLAYPISFSGSVDESQAGRVVAVYPAIGQVDLEFPWGSERYPVESLQRVTGIAAIPPSTENNTVPGGVIPPVFHVEKTALYWSGKDRQYKGTRSECSNGTYLCPKCKSDDWDTPPTLKKSCYKRRKGQSHKVLVCPKCLFVVKPEDIKGHSSYKDESTLFSFDRWVGASNHFTEDHPNGHVQNSPSQNHYSSDE